jgi:hypothetical protein
MQLGRLILNLDGGRNRDRAEESGDATMSGMIGLPTRASDRHAALSYGPYQETDAGTRDTQREPMDLWSRLGDGLESRPAVVAWAENEMQVFVIRDDGQLWDIYWDGAAWHDWHAHGGDLVGAPAACSWGADRIDVFARGRDGTLMHRWYLPSGWQPWESLGVHLDDDPEVSSWGPNRIDLFARSATGELLHGWWDGASWSFAGV